MTTQRRDSQGTLLGEWLRSQPELDSVHEHFIATDIDYIWKNYVTNEWMIIEEKRYGHLPTSSQINLYTQIDRYLKLSHLWKGVFALVMEQETPNQGTTNIYQIRDGQLLPIYEDVDEDVVISFLRFEGFK